LPTKLLLAGYFGCGNLGDDAIMLAFARHLDASGFDVQVMSGNPDDTYRTYGLDAIPRKEMKQVDKAIDSCDCVVFPGGGIFQDVTSLKSVIYYHHIATRAKKAGKRVAMVGQGVGPLTSFLGKRMASQAFNCADLIAVRDPGSAATLKSIGVTKKVFVTADLVFLLRAPEEDPDTQNFNVGDMRTVGLAPRPWGKGNDVANLFGELSRILFQHKMMPVLIEMDREHDGPLITEISKAQGGKVPDLRKLATPGQLQQRLTRMEGVIAMRLHAGILAASVGVPPLMISYDPKVAAFSKLLDLGNALPVEGLTAQRLYDRYIEFQKDRDRNKAAMDRKLQEMVKLAGQNIELIHETLRPTTKM